MAFLASMLHFIIYSFFVYLQLYIAFINIICTQNRIFRKWEWERCNNNKAICKEPTVDTQLWITVFYMQGFHCVNICVLSALAGESSSKNAAQPMRRNEENLILWFCKNIAVLCTVTKSCEIPCKQRWYKYTPRFSTHTVSALCPATITSNTLIQLRKTPNTTAWKVTPSSHR